MASTAALTAAHVEVLWSLTASPAQRRAQAKARGGSSGRRGGPQLLRQRRQEQQGQLHSTQHCSTSTRRCPPVSAASSSSPSTATTADKDPAKGVSVYRPASFDILLDDVAGAVTSAVADGHQRMEVEFPPLPGGDGGYTGSSDDFIDANTQLALALARKYAKGEKKICIVTPDRAELRRALKKFSNALQLEPNLSMTSLEDVPNSSPGLFAAARNRLSSAWAGELDAGLVARAQEPADMYIVINCSTVELPGIERFVDAFATKVPLVLFNLELDTLRSDLGLLGFPPKSLQYRFLSQFLPVFYIRPRDYSKSVSVAPFVLNYSGALLRIYPGPWQAMLKQRDNSYACVAEQRKRYNLGQMKEELLRAIGLDTEEKGSAMEFLRRGYKTSTWWEDDENLEESHAWRQ
eukprot:jgi/Chlat1/7343/Chrsp59S06951